MLADYAEALAKTGCETDGEVDLWPIMQVQAPPPGSILIPYGEALEMLRRASIMDGQTHRLRTGAQANCTIDILTNIETGEK